MDKESAEPPFTVEVDGEVKHTEIPSMERAVVLAEGYVTQNRRAQVEVFDRTRMRIFFSQSQ